MKTLLTCGFLCVALVGICLQESAALNPRKSLGQYSRTTWSRQEGLPQDTVTAIAQTADGYLWLGTDEGLARFDGYEFSLFSDVTGALPSNSITALTVGGDGSLWIGTTNGLVHFAKKKASIYTTANGLPHNSIDALCVDHTGSVWIVAGGRLARFDGNEFTVFPQGKGIPTTVRTVYEDPHQTLWVGGLGRVVRFADGKFVPVIDGVTLAGTLITQLIADGQNNLWISGSLGILQRSPQGKIRKFDRRDGLPDPFVRTLSLDRDGTLWAGTNSGLARLRADRFMSEGPGDLIRCLLEDREGDLWVGANNGLTRLRDDIFTVYGQNEGLPSDHPNAVFEDHHGRIWVAFHNSGLMLFSPTGYRVFTTREGLEHEEVFSIRESRSGDLLLSTRGGLVRMSGTNFKTYALSDEFGRKHVFDSLEDSAGKIWLALPGGLAQLQNGKLHMIITADSLGNDAVVSLHETKDGALWAGTYGLGLWRLYGETKRRFTTADGLSSNLIRSLYQDHDGTLWIATYGGGLNVFRDGRFVHFRAKDGLLSDNISNLLDDGESLWLSTTRGICRISKQQLREFSDHKIASLQPTNYGLDDGLRSAQAAPGYPVAGGGRRTSDGRLWFPTSRGLAVIDPNEPRLPAPAPIVHLADVTVDGKRVEFSDALRLQSGSTQIQIRYTAIHLSAPERVQYSYKLEGLDADWVRAGTRRQINYNSLGHGHYRFLVRAELLDGAVAEEAYTFEKLPAFYETKWFRVSCALAFIAGLWGFYQLHVRQLRYRFALVLEERARLAREIHDTLAQGFVGISSQLEGVAMALPTDLNTASRYLDLARKMARHCVTEARRSVLDMRASVLEGQNLAAALHSGALIWTAGTGVTVDVDVTAAQSAIPEGLQQHLLRITQEAVINAVKHARASRICVKLHAEQRRLHLQIVDDGRGFDKPDVFSPVDGHFGLIGMRERAGRLGGELRLTSHPGEGTQIDVTVPLHE
jgi:signal transduction histidine kinase/streptogramin lyase